MLKKKCLKLTICVFGSLDGVEYRIIQAVARDWNITFVRRDFSSTVPNPWKTIMTDISDNVTDMGICSVWMDANRADSFDLSTYYDFQCHKFLVPRPIRLNEATAIYRTFNTAVWLLFLCVFLVTGVLLMTLSRMEPEANDFDDGGLTTVRRRPSAIHGNFIRSMLEMMNIATGHGVNRIPKQHSLNVLLIRWCPYCCLTQFLESGFNIICVFSWIIVCLLIGVSYTTRYTALLTSPSYSKPINTVEDFLDTELMFGTLIPPATNDFVNNLRMSGIRTYNQLSERVHLFAGAVDRIDKLKTGRFALPSTVMSSTFIKQDFPTKDDLKTMFRVMKNCVTNYFTVFAFQKNSPYTSLFNLYIRRFAFMFIHRV